MKIGQLLSVFLLASVVAVTSMAPATIAAKAEPKTAEEAVRTFFESELNHDIDGMVRVAKDLRFYTTKAQKAEYVSAHKIHPLEHYEIVSQKEVNASRVDFLVTAVYKDMDDMPELPYSAIKEDGQWKIVIRAMEIDMSPDSPQPGKITIKSNKWENAPDSTVTPDTTDLLFWSFTDLQPKGTIFSANTFNSPRADGKVTLHGWQEWAETQGSMTYQLVKVYSGGNYQSYSSKDAGGNYTRSGTWFSLYMYAPTGNGYKVAFTNNGGYNVKGAGNVLAE